MAQDILVLNSGSSSLKFGVFAPDGGDEKAWLTGSAKGIGREDGSLSMRSLDGSIDVQQSHVMESQHDALQHMADALHEHLEEPLVAVGHRIVHGGPHLRTHARITDEVTQTLRDAVQFAPLHLPQSLELLEQAQDIFKDVPHYACLDTAFHQTMPARATHLALPKHYADEGVVRYGFHGLSYESIVASLGNDLPERLVVAHLGSGASLCAIHNGRSIDTTMGLTPTGGIPMATRTGDLDPGVFVYLMRTGGMDADAVEHLINKDSGLKGLSDSNDDMQSLLQRGDADAELAIDVFCTAVRKTIGAYAALMGGLDRVVFTGGIGEHAGAIRERICKGLDFLGVQFDVIETQEERQIARHCRTLLTLNS
ncbi:acetate kinase [Burkholderia sp. Leaf177]|uniref:acetate/propionate family kinase n=1 Tax=Burkholderia sp. Leaf177 TaxID=1736287 RepID=UPI0006FC25D6|nr:acetate/propionate family kinase [Burkholderia sp. Leaf177]KQR74225.1 acetate kinase [Burkholderia sp. Leaf177]